MAFQHDVMMAQMVSGAGFIAALDQSGGSTPDALSAYGIADREWSNDAEMFDLIHQMRVRVITSPAFNGRRVLAAILFERTMDGLADGVPVPTVLWQRGIVPLLKVDKGLEAEAAGVQLMKPIDELDGLLQRAKDLGVFGTKMRSVIKRASPAGIAAVVKQQFEVAARITVQGLIPVLEPEVSLKALKRSEVETILHDELLTHLNGLSSDQRVILKLTIPCEPDRYADLAGHPRIARIVALSGGYSRHKACSALAYNHGVIASFSRALLKDLRHDMSDAVFDSTLRLAVEDIYEASTVKVQSQTGTTR